MVSIVIPAYNCEKIIDKCLESVLNQTYADIEIIVIDDGSKDKTYDVVESYVKKDNRIKLKRIANSGPGGARNTGIDMATGEYLAFVDSDDMIYPNYIKNMMDQMENKDLDLVLCEMEWITEYNKIEDAKKQENVDKNTKKINVQENICSKTQDNCRLYENKQQILDNIIELMSSGWYINTLCCKIYKMDYIKQNNIRINEQLDMGEDFQFNIKCLNYIEKMAIIPDVLYQYYTVNSTLTYKYRPNMYEQRKVSIDEFSKFVDKYNLDKNIIHYLYIKLLFSDCMQMREYKDKYTKIARKERIKELINKEEIILSKNQLKAAGITQKVLLLAIKTNNIGIIDTLSWVLSLVRRKCPGIKRMSI